MTEKQEKQIVTTTEQANLLDIARGYIVRYRMMIVNGKKLSDEEIFALANYSASTGLDALAMECYYIPNVGPTPGIEGWRKKAQEQLEYEARQLDLKVAPSFWLEYYIADKNDAVFDDGDYAFRVVLKDSVSQASWLKMITELIHELNAAGETDVYKKAIEIAGKQPAWDAVGVVRKGENFGNREYYDRNERAKKRAEKLALKKRFPRIHLSEAADSDVYDSGDFKVEVSADKPKVTQSQSEILRELGFEADTPEETSRPYSPGYVKKIIAEEAEQNAGAKIGKQTIEEVNKALEYVFSGDKNKIRVVVNYLYGSHCPDNYLAAIHSWLDIALNSETGAFEPSELSTRECKAIYEHAKGDY